MKLHFRAATNADAGAISNLIDASYAPQVKRLYGDSPRGRWTHYEEERVLTYMSREREGVRVGLDQGRLLTVCVCRGFGALGWFHSIGVHPDFQHRGLGSQVIDDAQAYLTGQGVRCMGLMTWPDAVNNIGFYQHLGYRPAGLSLYAYRLAHSALIVGRAPLRAELFSESERQGHDRALAGIHRLSSEIADNLDYRGWVQWTHAHGLGDALLLWQDQRLLALALVYFGRPPTDWLEGKLLLASPDAEANELPWILEFIRRWAVARRCNSFGFPVDVTRSEAPDWCRRFGFRLFGDSMLNLMRGDDWTPRGVHLVRFSG